MAIYPIPIANNTPPATAKIMPKNWATACEVLVELPENKAPSTTRAIPDINNSMYSKYCYYRYSSRPMLILHDIR